MIEQHISAEATFDGHPDRIADAIVDTCLDEAIKAAQTADASSKVALKCGIKGIVHLFGEVTLPPGVHVDFEQIARNTIRDIGYTNEADGFSDQSPVIIDVSEQSKNIKGQVDKDNEHHKNRLGAGDQGHMYGGAVAEEGKGFMPMPITLSHDLARRVVELRHSGTLPWLQPDGKCQVVVRYVDGKPVGVDHVTIAASHNPLVEKEHIKSELYQEAVLPVLDAYSFGINPETQLVVNGTGNFVIFGPLGDGGADCRKIIDDTYGGYFSHGGGGFHGKDFTKVDATGLVGARELALAIVANGLAKKAQIQVTYVIGLPDPIAVNIETFGTSRYPPETLYRLITQKFDLSVESIIDRLGLRNPIYAPCAWGGLFGREPVQTPNGTLFPWEQVPSL